MKLRTGFVSNSSSSSFLCGICGRHEEGFDLDIEQADMRRCENDHTFCVEHTPSKRKDEEENEEEDREEEDSYEVKEKECPCCQFLMADAKDLLTYLIKESGKPREEIQQEMRARFPTFGDFKRQMGIK